MAALIYEVLWMKELSFLFGSTSYASSTVLTTFFAGIGIGNWYWGPKIDKSLSPQKVLAKLELGIAVSAIIFIFLRWFYINTYPLIASHLDSANLSLILKFILSSTLIALPCFLMGGTLPAFARLVSHKIQKGQNLVWLYTLNILGAAVGSWLAGFYLPHNLGFQASYLIPIGLNILVAALAWLLFVENATKAVKPSNKQAPLKRRFIIIAAGSGFLTISLQVLLFQSVALVSMNSIFSLATVLSFFLIVASAGSAIAYVLTRVNIDLQKSLHFLLSASAIAVAALPFLFFYFSNGYKALAASQSIYGDSFQLSLLAIKALLLPTLLATSVFPLLLKFLQTQKETVSSSVGSLLAINTLGSVLGAWVTGFILIQLLGLWFCFSLIAFAYILLTKFAIDNSSENSSKGPSLLSKLVPIAVLILFCANIVLPNSRVNKNEVVIDTWQGAQGLVSVVENSNAGDLMIRVNNHYTLGGIGSLIDEKRQAQLGFFLHPKAEKVFFLGLATGITAGAALDFAVKEVVVCEILEDVVKASREHFQKYTNGLFSDPRAKVIVADGREYLATHATKHDLIISDMFRPWAAGVEGLYSIEHFQMVSKRLNENGLFVQWLPLYQLTDAGFGTIAHTMTQAFSQVTMWRGNFSANKPVVALIGRNKKEPFLFDRSLEKLLDLSHQPDSQYLLSRFLVQTTGQHFNSQRSSDRQVKEKILAKLLPAGLLPFYLGSLSEHPELFQNFRVHSDLFPTTRNLMPTYSNSTSSNRPNWFVGLKLIKFYERLLSTIDQDTFTAHLTAKQKSISLTALDYAKSFVYFYEGTRTHKKEWLRLSKNYYQSYIKNMQIK